MISTPFTQMLAHKLRTECQAIVVGRVTDERDHPQLNIRHWSGPAPRRMVLSHSHDIDAILAECRADSLQSLLVERGLWDEIRVETAPLALHRGTRAATLPDCLAVKSHTVCGNNAITVYVREQRLASRPADAGTAH